MIKGFVCVNVKIFEFLLKRIGEEKIELKKLILIKIWIGEKEKKEIGKRSKIKSGDGRKKK